MQLKSKYVIHYITHYIYFIWAKTKKLSLYPNYSDQKMTGTSTTNSSTRSAPFKTRVTKRPIGRVGTRVLICYAKLPRDHPRLIKSLIDCANISRFRRRVLGHGLIGIGIVRIGSRSIMILREYIIFYIV